VFGLFSPKSDRPAPPKGQIEVVCPTCGAAQFESRLVVSTFCKKCGVHLTIQKKQVIASSASRAGGRLAADDWSSQTNKNAAPAAGHLPQKQQPTPPIHEEAASLIEPVTQEEEAEGGFGVFLKQQATPAPRVTESPLARLRQLTTASAPTAAADESEVAAERRPQSNSPPPTTAPEPMSASTLQKMKDQGMYRNAYFKDAECFDCNHKFKVSRSSRSANCPSCGSFVSLEDVEVNMPSTQAIKTRGDVLIRKRGHLSTDSVRCKDLRCQGVIEANIEASGDAIFRTVGTVIGTVHCKRFIIEKGADVTFINEVRAEEVDIQSRVTGTIFSSGSLVIGGAGAVNGDVTARSISIEPGGELNGAMNIVRTQPLVRPTF
jgi:cytoskeletal protein CcmA (bactofilin family)/ribosomal protein S27E